MRSLVQGVRRFRAQVFQEQRELYKQLARGQHPHTLFITCSDSRLCPTIMTQSSPGELFVLRNAGNIVPPPSLPGGEGPTIEFAVANLNVEHIIVCGHTQCGAIKGLMSPPEALDSMPLVRDWLRYAEATRRIVLDNYQDYSGDALHNIAVQEHVLMQLEMLQTHPCVASKLVRGDMTLHGWVFKIETGEIFAYDDEQSRFLPLGEDNPTEQRREPSANGRSVAVTGR